MLTFLMDQQSLFKLETLAAAARNPEHPFWDEVDGLLDVKRPHPRGTVIAELESLRDRLANWKSAFSAIRQDIRDHKISADTAANELNCAFLGTRRTANQFLELLPILTLFADPRLQPLAPRNPRSERAR